MQIENSQPANAGSTLATGIMPQLSTFVADYFSDPVEVENVRRAVRSWFAHYIPDYAERNNPFNLEGNAAAFEAVDELLSVMVRRACQNEQL